MAYWHVVSWVLDKMEAHMIGSCIFALWNADIWSWALLLLYANNHMSCIMRKGRGKIGQGVH